jgi:hypothetical protein
MGGGSIASRALQRAVIIHAGSESATGPRSYRERAKQAPHSGCGMALSRCLDLLDRSVVRLLTKLGGPTIGMAVDRGKHVVGGRVS